jgi:hypothetical protein
MLRTSPLPYSRKLAGPRSYTERYSYVQNKQVPLSIHKNLIIHSRSIMVPRRHRLVGPGLYGAPAPDREER